MRKIIVAIFASVVISFAAEQCNNGNFQIQAPLGSCINEGYVCFASTDERGGILFKLGADATCSSLLNSQKFYTHPATSETQLNTNISDYQLKLYFMEDPLENVGALAVATNTAFIINALNERFKVAVIYHRAVSAQTENDFNAFSVRLQSIGKSSP